MFSHKQQVLAQVSCTLSVNISSVETYLWKKSSMDSMVWSISLLQIPSLSRKQGSLTTDSSESCLMMLFSLSVFRFWYISWFRSWRKWLTLGLLGLPGRPSVGLLDMESSPLLARSRQQLQQSRPMGERQSSSDISETGGWKGGVQGEGVGISAEAGLETKQRDGLVLCLLFRDNQEGRNGRLGSSFKKLQSCRATLLSLSFLLLWLCCV